MTDVSNLLHQTRTAWQKPALLLSVAFIILIQFIFFADENALIGFPLNFYSYNAKFDVHCFFEQRLISTLLFWAVILTVGYGLLYLWARHGKTN